MKNGKFRIELGETIIGGDQQLKYSEYGTQYVHFSLNIKLPILRLIMPNISTFDVLMDVRTF